MASVASKPRHTSRTQTPAPGATRTTLLPAGVSASPAAATASATTVTPNSAAPSRTRALDTPTAAIAASNRLA